MTAVPTIMRVFVNVCEYIEHGLNVDTIMMKPLSWYVRERTQDSSKVFCIKDGGGNQSGHSSSMPLGKKAMAAKGPRVSGPSLRSVGGGVWRGCRCHGKCSMLLLLTV